MATYNVNYESINIDTGSYTTNDLGDGLTASTVHKILCTGTGTLNISPIGGGNFNWAATAGDVLEIVVGACTVTSGSFVGFKSQKGYTPYRYRTP